MAAADGANHPQLQRNHLVYMDLGNPGGGLPTGTESRPVRRPDRYAGQTGMQARPVRRPDRGARPRELGAEVIGAPESAVGTAGVLRRGWGRRAADVGSQQSEAGKQRGPNGVTSVGKPFRRVRYARGSCRIQSGATLVT
jgi:hypothetical protein